MLHRDDNHRDDASKYVVLVAGTDTYNVSKQEGWISSDEGRQYFCGRCVQWQVGGRRCGATSLLRHPGYLEASGMPARVEDDGGLLTVDRRAPAELYLVSVDSQYAANPSRVSPQAKSSQPQAGRIHSTNERLSVK